jgi:hypothetical protein
MKFNLTATRERIRKDMEQVNGALACQRALGGWKDRERFKCTDLELVRYVDGHKERLREYVVKLVVLRAAVNSNRLLRWVISRRAARIAKALDAVGP